MKGVSRGISSEEEGKLLSDSAHSLVESPTSEPRQLPNTAETQNHCARTRPRRTGSLSGEGETVKYVV